MYFATGINKKNGNRCFGYYKKLEDTIESVKYNNLDINEAGYYPIVVIEYCEEGFYPIGITHRDEEGRVDLFKSLWFEYNEKTEEYEPIEMPKEFEHYCGFAIG